MKALDYYVPEYQGGDYDFTEFGDLLFEYDDSPPYEIDRSYIFQLGNRYTYLNATDCSCWDGNYSGFTELTLAQLKKMAKAWVHGYGSEVELGKWVLENL